MARTRKQFGIRMINVTQVAFGADGIPEAKGYEVATVSENRAFRMFGATVASPLPGAPAILASWIQVSFQPPRNVEQTKAPWVDGEVSLADLIAYEDQQLGFLVESILREGLMVDGVRYERCLRSASQVRSGDAMFVAASLDRDEVRRTLSYGASFGKRNAQEDGTQLNPLLPADAVVENVAKMEARYGLALSSSLDTGLVLGEDLSYILYPDFQREVQVVTYRNGEETITITPTDGMGLIRPEAAVRVALSLEIVSEKVAYALLHSLHTAGYCDSMTHDPSFRTLWLKHMPSAFQVRCAGMKGLQVVYPHDELHGVNVDLVVLKSQWKFTFADGGRPTLEICAWQKPAKSRFVKLNYQFIQALSITGGELVGLAKKSLDLLNDTVLTDPGCAMAFLGLIASSEDDERFGHSLVSTLTRTLNANPSMLSDFHIQKSLRKLLKKHVTDMRMGRIPVEGEYRYIIGDPSCIFGQVDGLLAGDQNYMSGVTGTYGAFRSPQIDSSETALVNMVDVALWSELGLFAGLTVLNTYDDTLPRCGGADVDGDRMLFTAEPVIVRNVVNSPLLTTEDREGILSPISWNSLIAYDLATADGSQVGSITNLATTKIDLALCDVERLRGADQTLVIETVAVAADPYSEPLYDDCPF